MADENQHMGLPQDEKAPKQQGLGSDGVDVETAKDVFKVKASPKNAWPEVVGLSIEEAEKRIKEEAPEVRIQVVLPDHSVTFDYRLDRVRLYVDTSGKVKLPPTRG